MTLPSAPPTIRVADPPERHAARVVGEMVQWLAHEEIRLETLLAHELGSGCSGLGSVVAQRRFVERLRRADGGERLVDLRLWPRKKAGFLIRWVYWSVVTPRTAKPVEEGQPLPERPWLSCEVMYFTARRPTSHYRGFLLTHHAMQRLAERCGAQTPSDLLVVMKELWRGLVEHAEGVGEEAASQLLRLALPVSGSGVAIAERPDLHSVFIVKTVLPGGRVGGPQHPVSGNSHAAAASVSASAKRARTGALGGGKGEETPEKDNRTGRRSG